MKHKNIWMVPISAIAAFIVELTLYYVLQIIEFLLFEGKWGVNPIDGLITAFNMLFYAALSVVIYAVFLPKLFKKFKVDFKLSSTIIIAMFVIVSVIQCVMLANPGNTDFYYFLATIFNFYLSPFYLFLDEKQILACILVFVLNLFRPVCFVFGMNQSGKKI